MKNYVKPGQRLPLYGVGPHIVLAMAACTALGIILFSYIFRVGILSGLWVPVFRAAGVLLILCGLIIWVIGAIGSGMDDSIAENRLKTDGIYAWVRNPMYSGWWIAMAGISLMWHNCCLLLTIPVNWLIMTLALKNTEEKWLLDLYGEEYADYKKRVNRCIPRRPKRQKTS